MGSVGKFICVGLNYSDHAAESGMAVPAEPLIFMKATSAICGPNDNVVSPLRARNRQPEQLITVADLIDHYTKTELAFDLGNEGKSHATKVVSQTVSRQVGETHLGKAEHPRRSYRGRPDENIRDLSKVKFVMVGGKFTAGSVFADFADFSPARFCEMVRTR